MSKTPQEILAQNTAAAEKRAIADLIAKIDALIENYVGQPLEEQIFGRYDAHVWAAVRAHFKGWRITPGHESRSTTQVDIRAE